jgi:hypothetical protein
MIRAKISQRAVGQGGLSVGEVDCGGLPFRWVYDCGSNQSDALAREIASIDGPVNVLFLSHLDSDHVNGVDRLLCAHHCSEVVLPYLGDEDRLLVIAASTDGAQSGQFIDFMSDQAAWLLRRGVQRVTFIRGGDEGDGATDPPPDGGRGGEGELSSKWSRRREQLPSGGGDVGVIDAGAVLSLAPSKSSPIDWVLAPQVYPPPAMLAQAFAQKLALAFPGLGAGQIAAEAWSQEGRAKLRACYEALWTDHNKVSMSLYCGPTGQVPGAWTGSVEGGQGEARVNKQFRAPHGPGWISTGDADLAGARRRSAFLTAYRRYLATAGVLITPHHGSAASFHPNLINDMNTLFVGVAAAGPNSYGHPHDLVRLAIEALPMADWVQVNDSASTSLTLTLETT